MRDPDGRRIVEGFDQYRRGAEHRRSGRRGLSLLKSKSSSYTQVKEEKFLIVSMKDEPVALCSR